MPRSRKKIVKFPCFFRVFGHFRHALVMRSSCARDAQVTRELNPGPAPGSSRPRALGAPASPPRLAADAAALGALGAERRHAARSRIVAAALRAPAPLFARWPFAGGPRPEAGRASHSLGLRSRGARGRCSRFAWLRRGASCAAARCSSGARFALRPRARCCVSTCSPSWLAPTRRRVSAGAWLAAARDSSGEAPPRAGSPSLGGRAPSLITTPGVPTRRCPGRWWFVWSALVGPPRSRFARFGDRP